MRCIYRVCVYTYTFIAYSICIICISYSGYIVVYFLYFILAYYSTPKHPFVRWLLEDRLAAYKQQKERQMSDSSVVLNDQPFSFHIG